MSNPPGYLIVGHVCQDLIVSPGESEGAANGVGQGECDGPPPAFHTRHSFGGTVTYAGRTAHALGLNTAALTSAAPDMALAQVLPGIAVHCLPAAATTTFENRYEASGRQQIIRAVANRMGPGDVPAAWREAAIVHLGPVAQEVDPALVTAFPGAFVGVTPQGWLRMWDEGGAVRSRLAQAGVAAWLGEILSRVSAAVFSIEDVGGDEALAAAWAARAVVLVVTRGARGATLYVRGQPTHVPAPRVGEVDPTGAGDIFAAAFFACLRETQDPQAAARFATCLAAGSVTRRGLDSIPTAADVERCRAGMTKAK